MELLLAILLSVGYFAPFIFYRNLKSFVGSLTIFLSAHLLVGLATQFAGIFTYLTVTLIHLALNVTALAMLHVALKRKEAPPVAHVEDLKKKNNIFWAKVVIGAIASVTLLYQAYSVHYSFTGLASTIVGTQALQGSAYPYPYYSDEWVAVSMINYSISTKSLPLVNPLNANEPFMHFLTPFYSLVSELSLSFGLNPLTDYSKLTIFFGAILFISLYALLRSYGIGFFAAVLAVLSAGQITNGANLAVFWYLIPYLVGFIFFIHFLMYLQLKKWPLATASGLMACLLYPPMAVFMFAALIPILYAVKKELRVKVLVSVLAVTLALVFSTSIISIETFSFAETLKTFFDLIFRDSLLRGSVADYKLWYVMPLFFVPFAFHGLYLAFRQKRHSLVSATAFGLALWLIYPHIPFVVFLEHSRVVAVTGLLLFVAIGFSYEFILRYIELGQKENIIDPLVDPSLPKRISRMFVKYMIPIVTGACVLIFAFFAGGYTERLLWVNLKLKTPNQNGTAQLVSPATPANRYLHQDDLRLFSDLEKVRFLAPPWKGLVIGVATNNYPLESKSSTVTNLQLKYSDFMRSSCVQKALYIRDRKVEYIYSEQQTCKDLLKTLTLIGTSTEGLHLYKTSYKAI